MQVGFRFNLGIFLAYVKIDGVLLHLAECGMTKHRSEQRFLKKLKSKEKW